MSKQALLQKIDSISTGRKILILIACLVLLLALYWFFFLQDSLQQVSQLQDSIASLKQEISSYEKQVDQLPEIEDRLQARQKELAYAQRLLPDSMHDVENLLAEIEKLGKDVGVEFLLFEPGQEEVQEFYAMQLVNLRVQGPFHNLMQYFSRMSRLNRLVTLESLRLQPEGPQHSQEIQLMAPARIAVYRALTQEELQKQDED
ncbi:MAG: type 4a pilus biogenesis protein PilO [Thermodesulfobacteriota bacterium]